MRTISTIAAMWLMACGVAGCGLNKPSPEEVLQAKAVKAVGETLRDPQSAQYSDWKFFPAQNAACGRVNAKNGFGGYTGKATFAYIADKAEIAEDDRLSELSLQVRCSQLGLQEYNIEHAADRAARKARQAERAAKRAAQDNTQQGEAH